MMTLYTICLGSNSRCRHRNLAFARRCLAAAFPDIRFAREEDTQPLMLGRKALFANQVACFHSPLEAGDIRLCLKSIEWQAGRRPNDKPHEIVRLDIDLLLAGASVCKPGDLKRDYVCRGLKELGIEVPGSAV